MFRFAGRGKDLCTAGAGDLNRSLPYATGGCMKKNGLTATQWNGIVE